MASQPPTITILGSLNVDFITVTPRIPEGGETLSATSFTTGFGGKGANQAVACARLAPPGHVIRMVGKVGDDSFGADYLDALRKEGMDVEGVRRVEGEKTGVTNIIVEEESGENRILFVANANNKFEAEEALVGGEGKEKEVVVMQLEIPFETVSSIFIHADNREIPLLIGAGTRSCTTSVSLTMLVRTRFSTRLRQFQSPIRRSLTSPHSS
jgi:ribokinase